MGTDKCNDSLTTPNTKPAAPYEIVIEGRPRTKGRPRMTRSGRAYTPKETVEAEDRIVEAVGDNHPVFEGPIKLELHFTNESTYVKITSLPDWEKPKLRGDLDNYVKLAADGLQKAGVIANDRDVVWLQAEKT